VHDTHYLRIFVRKLRQKIEPHPDSPKILVTELGVGYRLAQTGSDAENGGVLAGATSPAQSEP
jgi:two-component system KDP operon response regulator KdpE